MIGYVVLIPDSIDSYVLMMDCSSFRIKESISFTSELDPGIEKRFNGDNMTNSVGSAV
jgi:hypothetical protein